MPTCCQAKKFQPSNCQLGELSSTCKSSLGHPSPTIALPPTCGASRRLCALTPLTLPKNIDERFVRAQMLNTLIESGFKKRPKCLKNNVILQPVGKGILPRIDRLSEETDERLNTQKKDAAEASIDNSQSCAGSSSDPCYKNLMKLFSLSEACTAIAEQFPGCFNNLMALKSEYEMLIEKAQSEKEEYAKVIAAKEHALKALENAPRSEKEDKESHTQELEEKIDQLKRQLDAANEAAKTASEEAQSMKRNIEALETQRDGLITKSKILSNTIATHLAREAKYLSMYQKLRIEVSKNIGSFQFIKHSLKEVSDSVANSIEGPNETADILLRVENAISNSMKRMTKSISEIDEQSELDEFNRHQINLNGEGGSVIENFVTPVDIDAAL